ncbi:hypothetical protein ACWIDW_05025 [Microbacterium sp. NPDC055312]
MMRLYHLRAARRRRHLGRDDEGSALLLTVVFTLFAGGIMLVLLSVLLSQMQAIQLAQKNTRTGYAAQAGIQSTLSTLRSNTESKVVAGTAADYGNPSKLPQTITGKVDDGDLAYSVTVKYYAEDPTNKDSTWLDANELKFAAGTKPLKQPRFARIVSTGSDAGAAAGTAINRTVTALYTFTTTNVNIPGGRINSSDGNSCLKAVNDKMGSRINMRPSAECTDDKLNLWVYDTDYRLKLASTIGKATTLCITGKKWSGATSDDATLQPCAEGKLQSSDGNQLWSWEPPGSWVGQNKANDARSNRWLSLESGKVVEKSSTTGLFNPAPSVGAGAASYNTNQIVNYSEFGRCMDVTDEQIGKAFMIVYPCKQDPTKSGANLKWNHKWYYSEPTGAATTSAAQSISVKLNNTTPYCLTTSGAANTDVHFKSCDPVNVGSLNSQQKFIRNGNTGNTLTSYTFQLADDRTRCLAAVPESGYAWSHVRLVPCSGSTTQKWNAPALITGSSLGGYKEIG